MVKKIWRFLNKKFMRSSLRVYIIGTLTMMVLCILLVMALIETVLDKKLLNMVSGAYAKKYGVALPETLSELYSHITYKDLIDLSPEIAEWYDRNIYFANISIYVIIIVGVIVFGTIMIKRVAKELHKFEEALEKTSNESLVSNQTVELSSDIKEFNNICVSYNRMAKRLRDSEEQRNQMAMEQRKMIADISHDIKTPITVIQGYSRAVCDDIVDEQTKKKYLEVICRKSDTVAELTNTLHEYSKLEHPEFTLNLEEGDICEYFRSYLATKYQELDVAGFELEAEIPEKKIMFSFDKKQLKRVFENLITNSFRHNEKGTLIYAEMLEGDDNITIHIGDNGKGIPQEIRDSIFEPFVVGNKSRTGAKGSGLGLAISKKIVESHNGTIALIEDSEGRLRTLYEIVLKK